MRDQQKYLSVNWIDGMKINKNHFVAQDDAWRDALHGAAALHLSPLRFGVLTPSAAGEDTFNVKISVDNQGVLRVALLSCQAVTPGGIRINIPAAPNFEHRGTDGVPAISFRFTEGKNETGWWVVLLVHPFDKLPAGSPDLAENPPRHPYVLPSYTLEVVSAAGYSQFVNHPYALTIGKLAVNSNDIRIDNDYIPPCFSIAAHPDLVSLYTELDKFYATLELKCSLIVQKIFVKKQQNDISELIMFLCDRMILHLSQALTVMRWAMIHESPAMLFAGIATLARVMKNTIDLRIGSGKEEMMNYLSEWCELKQGELEAMLSNIANMRYDNNDINSNIQGVTLFVKVTARLFDTLSKLDFIGKRKDSGIFVKEEQQYGNTVPQQPKAPPKRRFFGD